MRRCVGLRHTSVRVVNAPIFMQRSRPVGLRRNRPVRTPAGCTTRWRIPQMPVTEADRSARGQPLGEEPTISEPGGFTTRAVTSQGFIRCSNS